jgi:hypothetical protein
MGSAAPSIILTADDTMMSRYRGGIFLGFATCAPQGILPDWLFFFPLPLRSVVKTEGRSTRTMAFG